MHEISRQSEEFLFGRSIEDYTEYEEFFATDMTVHCFDHRYILEVAVPGFHSHELTLKVEKDLLILKGFKEEERRDQNHPSKNEKKVAVFQRTFVLPNDVGSNTINANYQPGLVHVVCLRQLIPSNHQKHFLIHSRRIKITSGQSAKQSWFSQIKAFLNRLWKH